MRRVDTGMRTMRATAPLRYCGDGGDGSPAGRLAVGADFLAAICKLAVS